jgi:hypothetical protein
VVTQNGAGGTHGGSAVVCGGTVAPRSTVGFGHAWSHLAKLAFTDHSQPFVCVQFGPAGCYLNIRRGDGYRGYGCTEVHCSVRPCPEGGNTSYCRANCDRVPRSIISDMRRRELLQFAAVPAPALLAPVVAVARAAVPALGLPAPVVAVACVRSL